jgi:hypothetical protein
LNIGNNALSVSVSVSILLVLTLDLGLGLGVSIVVSALTIPLGNFLTGLGTGLGTVTFDDEESSDIIKVKNK